MKKFIIPLLALLAFWASPAPAHADPVKIDVGYYSELLQDDPTIVFKTTYTPEDFWVYRAVGSFDRTYTIDLVADPGNDVFTNVEEAVAYYENGVEVQIQNLLAVNHEVGDFYFVDQRIRKIFDSAAKAVWDVDDQVSALETALAGKADASQLPPAPSVTMNVSRSIVTGTGATGFQVSATRPALVCYTASTSTTATIGGASAATVFLETAPTNSATAGDWKEAGRTGNSQTITLAIALQSAQATPNQVCGFIPAGHYAKLRNTGSGSNSSTYGTGWELLL